MSARPQFTKAEREQIEAMREALRPFGFTSWVEDKTKHRHLIVVDPGGGQHKLTIVCTPQNDGDAVTYARQKAARLARAILEGIRP